MKERLTMIIFFILLLVATVLIFGSTLKDRTAPIIHSVDNNGITLIPQEGGAFQHNRSAEYYDNMPDSERTMATYYNNRAYPGAPPMIPHTLLSEKGIGGKACLQCHQNGGYVPEFKAYAPITPHATWLSCKQCHVPKTDNNLFVGTNWIKPSPPPLGSQALITSPLAMPHGLQNRENCLSCHAGPGAPKEIRVTHPERINCRQCHVPASTNIFLRKPSTSNQLSFKTGHSDLTLKKNDLSQADVKNISEWINSNN